MKVLFDQGTPVPLRRLLTSHEVHTAFEMGWSNLENGDLLGRAEVEFEVLVTTDRSLRNQQNLAGRRIAVLVLPTTSWPLIQENVGRVVEGLDALRDGGYFEVVFEG